MNLHSLFFFSRSLSLLIESRRFTLSFSALKDGIFSRSLSPSLSEKCKCFEKSFNTTVDQLSHDMTSLDCVI